MTKFESHTWGNCRGIVAIAQDGCDEVENCDSFLTTNKYF